MVGAARRDVKCGSGVVLLGDVLIGGVRQRSVQSRRPWQPSPRRMCPRQLSGLAPTANSRHERRTDRRGATSVRRRVAASFGYSRAIAAQSIKFLSSLRATAAKMHREHLP